MDFSSDYGLGSLSVSQVANNEADLGVAYVHISGGSSMVEFAPAIDYDMVRWISRAPRRILPITNLLMIYDIPCCISICISMVSVSIFLIVAAKVGTHYGVGTHDYVNVALVPFR